MIAAAIALREESTARAAVFAFGTEVFGSPEASPTTLLLVAIDVVLGVFSHAARFRIRAYALSL